MKVKVINRSRHELPQYETPQSAGLDIRANVDSPVVLKPLERKLVPTGLYVELPVGYEAQIRPRSGLALKHGISLLNTPGTIDQSYTGDIGVILINLGQNNFIVNPGDRIAQAVLNKFEKIEWDEVSSLDATERGDNGFGSTGK